MTALAAAAHRVLAEYPELDFVAVYCCANAYDDQRFTGPYTSLAGGIDKTDGRQHRTSLNDSANPAVQAFDKKARANVTRISKAHVGLTSDYDPVAMKFYRNDPIVRIEVGGHTCPSVKWTYNARQFTRFTEPEQSAAA